MKEFTQPINDIVLYRYDVEVGMVNLCLNLREFVPVKETPKGWWVKEKHSVCYSYTKKRWVSKNPIHKSFCYPTKEQAIKSFVRRKEVYVDRLKHQLKMAELSTQLGPDVNKVPHGIEYCEY